MIAHTRSGLAGETATPILPSAAPFGPPGLREISFHVSPPSVDLYRPLSGQPLSRLYGVCLASQIAEYNTLGLEGCILKSAAIALFDLDVMTLHVLLSSFNSET